ncbi:MAG: hypothetical protein IT269_03355 [Saprospiraceae bacterium]|nr:hypothetical protein [Saprospiraceae bacterium]
MQIQTYFDLQRRMFERWLTDDLGIGRVWGYLGMAGVFAALSGLLFYKVPAAYAGWVYAVLALSFVLKLSERERSDFLKNTFTESAFRRIRLTENALAGLPFALVLVLTGHWLPVLAFMLTVVVLALVRMNQGGQWVVPTPYFHWPFEFIVGFRRSVMIMALAGFLVYKTFETGNAGLGYFAQILLFFTFFTYYLKPESRFFVWLYSQKTDAFLRHKIWLSVLCASVLTMPLALVLGMWATENWWIPLAIQVMGYLFLSAIVLAKYAAFPGEITLPQVILLALCFTFPPLILLVIWMFWKQARRQIKPLAG